MYTEKQLKEFDQMVWWDLKNDYLNLLFKKWMSENKLTMDDLDNMYEIVKEWY